MPHYPIEALGPTDAQLVQLDRQRDQSSPCEHRSYSSAFSTNIPGSMYGYEEGAGGGRTGSCSSSVVASMATTTRREGDGLMGCRTTGADTSEDDKEELADDEPNEQHVFVML
ncbi:hypothetical protein PtB15_3B738 [Puccinia triticina]|nr:hypothetical protein PtB15_3B738 [Puccinia triticina]